MSSDKKKQKTLFELTVGTASVFFIFFFFLIITSAIIELFQGTLEIRDLWVLADSYAKLILTSWSASILLISLVILTRHYESIDYFIRKRMTEVGPSGVKGSVSIDEATNSEMKQKTIKETKEDDKVAMGISGKDREIKLQTGVTKDTPNTTKEEVLKRYKKISQIEEAVQTNLIDTYNDRYKPQVRISSGDKKVIVDGLLYSKKGKIKTAIEIRYISSKRYEVLRYIISRKLRQLSQFGIKRLTMILVGDNISKEEAQKIQDENLHQAKMYFYNWIDDNLSEVELSSRDTHIF